MIQNTHTLTLTHTTTFQHLRRIIIHLFFRLIATTRTCIVNKYILIFPPKLQRPLWGKIISKGDALILLSSYLSCLKAKTIIYNSYVDHKNRFEH